MFIEENPEGSRAVSQVTTSTAAFIGAASRGRINKSVRVRSFLEFEKQFGGLGKPHLGYAVQHFFLNGGTDAWIVRVAANASASRLTASIRALDTADAFNLLALPGINQPDVLSKAADYCQQRRAFLLVDSPAKAKTPSQLKDFILGGALARTSYAAIYYPWIKVSDGSIPGKSRVTPPCGAVAGVIARNDATRGVWKSPANLGLAGVPGLEYNLTDSEIGLLNPFAVNCLRVNPASGPVVWGARTMAGDDQTASEWKYISVRRTALFIEESIYRGTQWAVFEPNAEPLWAQLRSKVEDFLNALFRQGAFQGASPRNAFYVKCDARTTTQADLTAGIVHLTVGFAPLKTSEFVNIQIQIKAAAPG